jgi:hypothetical protein
MSAPSLYQLLPVGTIVKLKVPLYQQPAGTLGIVYEDYALSTRTHSWDPMRGVSVITEDGEDLGGFTVREQEDYLEMVRVTGFRYRFINVMRLREDWEAGIFNSLFQSEKPTDYARVRAFREELSGTANVPGGPVPESTDSVFPKPHSVESPGFAE